MYSYNGDPSRGLRKKKPRWNKLVQEYGALACGVLLFLCICTIVAVNGRAGYWQKLAKEHETHHHRWKHMHSSLEQALALEENKVALREQDLMVHKETRAELEAHLVDLQHQVEADKRAAAAAANELHAVQLELQEAQKAASNAKLDLETCLKHVKAHSSTSEESKTVIEDLNKRVSAHEARELQLLQSKRDLEAEVARLKAAAGTAAGSSAGGSTGAASQQRAVPNAHVVIPSAPPVQHASPGA